MVSAICRLSSKAGYTHQTCRMSKYVIGGLYLKKQEIEYKGGE